MTIDNAWSELGAGDPFVLVHGFTGSQLDWLDVAAPLAESRRVLMLDHRGHGESPNLGDEADYSLAHLIDDFAAFVDARSLERFDLLGHSMGGMVAMRYALAHPDRIRSLILMDTSPRPLGDAMGWLSSGVELARTQGLAAMLEMIEPFLGGDERKDEILRRMRVKFGQMDVAAFCALGEALQERVDITADLAALTMPTTVIVGENDVPFRAPSDEMVATIPGAVLEVIANAAHSPQEDDPTAWLAAVTRHFTRL